MILEPDILQSYRETFEAHLAENKIDEAVISAQNISAGRVAQVLTNRDYNVIIPFLEKADQKQAGQILAHFSPEMSVEVLEQMDPKIGSTLLDDIPIDHAADIMQLMDQDEASELFSMINPNLEAMIRDLMRYESGTVGAVMNSHFTAVKKGASIADTMLAIKDAPVQIENKNYVFVVNKKGTPEGVISMKDLIRTNPKKLVDEIMTQNVVAVYTDDDALESAQLLRNRRFQMLPVLNEEDRIAGVLLLDDAIEILSENMADMFMHIGAASADESFYTPPLGSVKKRLPWMAGNVFLNLGAVAVIASFEATIEAIAALAIFLPMITDMGGNVGIQALSVSIRSIALGEVRLSEYWRAAKKEIVVGLINGLALGALFAVIAYIVQANMILGLVAGAALGINVLVAGIVGGTLPFLIKRWGGDPAMMTGPVLTTITDITGVTIYLGLSTYFLMSLVGG
ncbi:magnesium transporter [Rhodohalobacter sp. SW132]|uniref:magnesium transporter n=1 Tax=Rhodohalobacter sp. SW132 TaxID=2293433 RepID=UPI000E21CD6D|nr:magnesium transporter [Rhodohalobacter sp. SW132]REL38411.1 magnesium transporter [Rhodohalobacter sp. SW132]